MHFFNPIILFAAQWILLLATTSALSNALKEPKPQLNKPRSLSSSTHSSRHNITTTTISYGPFTVPPSTTNGGMVDFAIQNASAPCTHCLLTTISASLEYPNGTTANSDTGMWLHHVLLVNTAKRDTVCPLYSSERFFASGNERTVVDLSGNGTGKAGYHLAGNASLHLFPELMNERDIPRDVLVTITYEHIPYTPVYHTVTPIWLDITGVCGGSEYAVPANSTAFSITSPAWTANVTGEVVFSVNHVHDGGMSLDVLKDDEKMCEGVPTYGATPGYVETMPMDGDGMGMGMDMDMVHISNISSCVGFGRMRKGQEWGVTARYDFDMHPGMQEMDGSLSPVMGISILYILDEKKA